MATRFRNPLDFAGATAGVDIKASRGMQFVSPSGPGVDCDPGLSPASPPRGFQIADAPPVRQLFPPYLYKLSASQDFNRNSYREVLPAGVGQVIEPASLVFQAPATMVGWLQNFSQYTLTPSASTYISWCLLINGAPVPGYDDVRNPPGIANLVEVFQNGIQVRIPLGGKVSVRITNLDASGPVTVGGLLRGWYHPQVAETRAWGITP
ncbi:MAG TPA: hypothetical protein VH374_26420 [Polyangia bacterium]|jgi:hypothetical protein|nr:hypothetical protein [Polyangia bacterium]